MSELHDLVREFHEKFGVAINDRTRTHNSLCAKLIREEAGEASDALLAGDLAWIAKELADLLIVAESAAITLGIDLDLAVRIVHRSNMTKVGYDGKPIIRADGKIMKGPNYRPPDMTPALPRSRQSQQEVSPGGLAILTGWPHLADLIPDRDGEATKLIRDGLMTKDGELTDAGRAVIKSATEDLEALRAYARNLSPNAVAILTGSTDAVVDEATVDALHRSGLLHNNALTDHGVMMMVTILSERP